MGYIEKGRARTITKVILWAVVISFVGSIFVTWGMQGSNMVSSNSLISVNGVGVDANEITLNYHFYEYVKARLVTRDTIDEMIIWNGAVAQIGNSLAGSIYQTVNSENQEVRNYLESISLMIGDMILASEADKAGIRVSDKEITSLLGQIYRDPDGKFLGKDQVAYDMTRFNIGTDSEPRFKKLLKRHLKARHYVQSLFASVQPELQQQIREVYDAQNRNVTFTFTKFDPVSLIAELEYSDEDLKSYLNENNSEFVLADMVVLDKALFTDSLEITDSEIQAYYDENKADEFTNPETRDVRRILIRLPEDADEAAVAAAEAKVAEVYQELARAGEEFDTVARKYSEDESARSEDGLIKGLESEGARDETFITTVFSLENVGDYNQEAIKTVDGLEVIQLAEIHAGGVTPLEEVRTDIRETLAEERVDDEALIAIDALRAQAQKLQDFTPLADAIYVTYEKNIISIEGKPDIFALNNGLISAGQLDKSEELFAASTNDLTNVLNVGDNLAFFKITAKGESLAEKFDLIRPAIVDRYTLVKSRELAEEKALSFAKSVQSVSDLEAFKAAVETNGLTAEDVTTNKYQGVFQYGADVVKGAFNAEPASVIGPIDQSSEQYVLFVSNIDELDDSAFEEKKPEIRKQLIDTWMYRQPNIMSFMDLIDSNFSALLETQVSKLITSSEIKLNNNSLRQMFGSPQQ